ncbi:hypothetical protein NWP21_18245 [Anabaenopsis sp. FSS-46]|uniref:hypothetical protein n=1 Tax=Anabaenopsis sp. FSS-46 TaxID=2971766 RepID=UPI002475325F|nr:hypothetical protein [Anabaenopsis sp. FSS-46]MDH6100741.1 hypothetical protein [Anabaenopsis sp. FSS-46]
MAVPNTGGDSASAAARRSHQRCCKAIAQAPNESNICHHLDNLAGFNRLQLSDRGFNPWLLAGLPSCAPNTGGDCYAVLANPYADGEHYLIANLG